MSDKKYIDKQYLLETLRNFDKEILSKKYTNNGQGTPGQNGITPHIGDNGNWYIGDYDTNVKVNGSDGEDGFTPTIKENDNNTDDCYCLDITNKDKSFTTPNLMDVIGKEYKNKSVGTPVGEIISYMGTIVPENYLICDGTVYQISDYPILAQHIADNFGSKNFFGGDGTTTFAVPDLRGEFLRGSGINGHINNLTGNKEGNGADVGIHQAASVISPVGSSSENNVRYFSASSGVEMWEGIVNPDSTSAYYGGNTWIKTSTPNASQRRRYFTERPTNTSVLYCIKYQPTYWITPSNE